MEQNDKLPGLLYDSYSVGVGGVAFNGDPLPLSEEFFADPTKQKQVNAWRQAVTSLYGPDYINLLISQSKVDTNYISDGYHTFGELYEHRIVNYMALCRIINENRTAPVWKTTTHSDGSVWEGWFILGINTEPGEQITYHLPMDKWDQCNFITVTKAPEWDGHTSADVLERLAKL